VAAYARRPSLAIPERVKYKRVSMAHNFLIDKAPQYLQVTAAFPSLHRRRTIFRLGEQKLNDFSAGEAKIGEKTIKTIKFKV